MAVNFVHGDPVMADYTATAALAAGDVIVVGASVQIVHRPIASGDLGAVATGGGVYEAPKGTGSLDDWVHGAVLYWDDSTDVITDVAGSNKKIGTAEGAAADADTTAKFLHIPNNA